MAEYIEREAVYKSLLQEAAYLCWNLKDAESRGYIGAAQAIRNIPAADVAPVASGEWDADGRCTRCGAHAPFYSMSSSYFKSPFCFLCGARMDGGEEDA